MKRYISVVFLALAVILASQSAFAERNQPKRTNPGGYHGGEKPAYHQGNMNPYLPKDTVFVNNDSVGKHCNKEGAYDESARYRCKEYVSHSRNVYYRVRFSQGEGDRIFVMKNGKPELYVQFTGGSDIYRIVYQTPEAKQYAENNGYRFDERNSTMVAVGTPQDNTQAVQQLPPSNQTTPQTTASALDCASKTALLEKMKCLADSAAASKK